MADIHLAEVGSLQAGFPSAHRTGTVERMLKDNGAILAVNGDYYLNIHKGIIVRNGVVLQSEEGTNDICVLNRDGVMKTYTPGTYSAAEILESEPWQVWCFGPELLDSEGRAKEDFNTSANIMKQNPRTAIDGRLMGNSNGASMKALSDFMADLGCKAAYNLDGGASSGMAFDRKLISKPSGGGRAVSDVVMICEPEFMPFEEN